MDNPAEITRLLGELSAGRGEAKDRLVEAVYPELKRIAGIYLSRERTGHTLQATALVNEAYLQLAGKADQNWRNRAHFFAVAAQLMRHILVDYARKRRTRKRGGTLQRLDLTEGLAITDEQLDVVLQVDQALNRLEEWDSRQCRVVELRYFSGLTETEIADVLGIAPRTVKRDWTFAKAWLRAEMNKEADNGGSAPATGAEAPKL